MPLSLQCPNPTCGKTATAPDEFQGRTVRCRQCGHSFVAGQTVDYQSQRPLSETEPESRPKTKAAADPFPEFPAEFGRYLVLKLLGRGGMGAVYLAEDSNLGRRVALKIPGLDVAGSPQRAERFVREARAAAALQHPNICTVYDAGQVDGRPYITMAFIEGEPLNDRIDPDVPMTQLEAARIARRLALGLQDAHSQGIVHRDLKPANVMVTPQGEPVVMDFGLAKRVFESRPDAHERRN